MPRYRWVEPPLRLHDQPPPCAKKTLLDLPAELRNAIYELVVFQQEHRDITRPQPPLTRVCRQIRSECVPISMQRNNFQANFISVDAIEHFSKWIRQLGLEHGPHIGSLLLMFPYAGIRLDKPCRIMQTWDDLLWSIKLVRIRPDALLWSTDLFNFCILNFFTTQFQVFFDNIISPLLELYDLSHSTIKPGTILHDQRNLYRKREENCRPWKSAEALDAETDAATVRYLDGMYDGWSGDAYSWIEGYQQLILERYSMLKAEVFGLERQLS